MIDNADTLSHLLTQGYTDHMSISCGHEVIFLNSFLVAAVNVVTTSLLKAPSSALSLINMKATDLQHLLQCFSQQKKDFVPNQNMLETLLLLVKSNTYSENGDGFAFDFEQYQFETSNPLTPPEDQLNQSEPRSQITDQSEIETNDHNYFEMLEGSEEPVIISFKKLDEEKLEVLLDKTIDNKCGICKVKTSGLSYLRIHLKKVHGVVIHCHLCPKTFTSYKTRRSHLAGTHKIGVPGNSFKCDLCGKVLRNNNYLAHMRSHEVKEGRNILGLEEVPCEECGKLVHPGRLQHHMYDHNKRRKTEIKSCEKCGKEMEAYKLVKHRYDCGRKADTSICNICGKEVTTINMERHIQVKHDPNYKPEPEKKTVSCEICGKMFSKIGLKRHMIFHGEGKECDICGAKVKKLAIHKKTVHLTEDQVKHRCPECGKGFRYLKNMEEHRMSVHLKLYPYKCRYAGCEAKYNDKGNRSCHEKKKHGMRYNQFEKLKLEQNETEFT